MLQSLVVLMFFQFLGELLVQATGLPLPGPVCGMLFLLAWLRSGWTSPFELTGVGDRTARPFRPAVRAGRRVDHRLRRPDHARRSWRSCWRSCCRSWRRWPSPPAPSAGVRAAQREGGPIAECPMIESAKLVGLLQGPLVWLPATLAIYVAATALWCRHGKAPILNPTMLSIIAIGAVLLRRGCPIRPILDGVAILNYCVGYGGGGACRPRCIATSISCRGTNPQARRRSVRGSTTSLVPRPDRRQGGRRLRCRPSCPLRQRRRPRRCRSRSARGIGGLPGSPR